MCSLSESSTQMSHLSALPCTLQGAHATAQGDLCQGAGKLGRRARPGRLQEGNQPGSSACSESASLTHPSK